MRFTVEMSGETDFSGASNMKVLFEEAIDSLSADEIYFYADAEEKGGVVVDAGREITGTGTEWIVPLLIFKEGMTKLIVDKVGVSAEPVEVYGKKIELDNAKPTVYDPANWMQSLSDSTYLNQMAIPGTHDSATYGVVNADVPDIARCQFQSKNIRQQLNDGIRFFDLRVGSDGKLHHGHVICFDSYPSSPVTIEKVFDTIAAFLNSHTKETVLVLIKHEYGDSSSDYLSHVNAAINNHSSRVYTNANPMTKISDVRNKIVLLDGGGNLGKGMKASAMHGGDWGNNGTIYWQNYYDIGDWTMTVNKRASLKADEILTFNKNIIGSANNLFCFNWWNKAWNSGTSVLYYAREIESHFYCKWNGYGKLYYPRGVQIMDYYNCDLVCEVINSNWNL